MKPAQRSPPALRYPLFRVILCPGQRSSSVLQGEFSPSSPSGAPKAARRRGAGVEGGGPGRRAREGGDGFPPKGVERDEDRQE